jgi:hypothetical protein
MEVLGVAARFRADVWAESVVQAVEFANACYPGCEVRLLFPIDPEAFFTQGQVAAGKRMVSADAPETTGFAEVDREVALASHVHSN